MSLNGKYIPIGEDLYKLTVYLGKDKNGIYRRRTKEVECTNPKKLDKLLRDFISEIEEELEQATGFTPSELLLKDYFKQWLAIKKPDLERNTYESYKWEIDTHITPVIGHIPLAELTPLNIQEFYTGKIEHGRIDKKGGLSTRVVKYLHSILHQALEKAVDLEMIDRNPCSKIKPPKNKKRPEEQIVFLDKEQLAKFLIASKCHRDYALIFTAAYTGMRQSELLALTWDKVFMKNKTIKIDQAVNLLENGEFDDGRTKTASSNRTIDVSQRVISVLKQHKKEQLKYLAASGKRNEKNLVFTDPDGSYVNRKTLAQRFRNLADKSKHYHLTFKGMRHTHATILLSEGWYPNDVSKRLGHSSIDTTLRVYGHVIPKQQKKLADKFDELIQDQ